MYFIRRGIVFKEHFSMDRFYIHRTLDRKVISGYGYSV